VVQTGDVFFCSNTNYNKYRQYMHEQLITRNCIELL
jgi:hypothetical protein